MGWTWNQLTGPKGTTGSVADWMNNSTIQPITDALIQEATAWIYSRLRHWRMKTPPISGALTLNSDNIAVPIDMIEPAVFRVVGNYARNMVQKPEESVLAAWQYDGSGNRVPQQPRIYYFNQSYLAFDSPSDRAYPYILTYFQIPAALSNSNPTNFLTNFYPALLRCAIMSSAAEWAKDSGVGNYDRTYWEERTLNELAAAQADSDRAARAVVVGATFDGLETTGPLQEGW